MSRMEILISSPQSSSYSWNMMHASLSRLTHSLTVTSTSWFGRSSSTFRLLSYWNKTWIKWKMRTGLDINLRPFGYHLNFWMWNRSIRCKYHAYINKCIQANNGKQITWFWLTINCIGWNPKSKAVKWTTLRGQFVVQFNAPIIPYFSLRPKGWGFQLTGAWHVLSFVSIMGTRAPIVDRFACY